MMETRLSRNNNTKGGFPLRLVLGKHIERGCHASSSGVYIIQSGGEIYYYLSLSLPLAQRS